MIFVSHYIQGKNSNYYAIETSVLFSREMRRLSDLFFRSVVIATSDRKIVQMTSSTTVPFLASFSPPTSHGQAEFVRMCLADCLGFSFTFAQSYLSGHNLA